MNLHDRIQTFAEASDFLLKLIDGEKTKPEYQENKEEFDEIIQNYYQKNSWFTPENIKKALRNIAQVSDYENIQKWLSAYDIPKNNDNPKTIAVIMAGNIPFVGFHDLISVLITGNKILAKISSKDKDLPKAYAKLLIKINPEFEKFINITAQTISDFDAVIATGSNNTARYFEYYFGKFPHIIRKNRSSVAIIHGNETKQTLKALADDIFSYFGLGCRNVSKIYIPENYDFNLLFKAFACFDYLKNHNKYANNYDYNKAMYLLNNEQLLDNGFVLLKQDAGLASPVSVIFYEYYNKIETVADELIFKEQSLQCIVSDKKIADFKTIKPGQAQKPELWEYPDNIDIVDFVLKI